MLFCCLCFVCLGGIFLVLFGVAVSLHELEGVDFLSLPSLDFGIVSDEFPFCLKKSRTISDEIVDCLLSSVVLHYQPRAVTVLQA